MKLITERLRERFGNIYLEVTAQNSKLRFGFHRRTADDAILAYHRVRFHPEGITAMGRLHKVIYGGKPMGEVIKRSGIEHVRSESRAKAERLTAELKRLFHTVRARCRKEVITYTIKGSPYAVVEEFFNPEFIPVPNVSAKSPQAVRGPVPSRRRSALRRVGSR